LTITFDEAEFSEATQASAFAKRFKTDHHEIRITKKDFAESLDGFLKCVDQPTCDGLNTYFVSRAAAQLGLKVVFVGLGGDEVFFWIRTLSPAGALG